jgi:alpha-L-fucosidase 2
VDYTRELLVSSPSQLIVMQLAAGTSGALTLNVSLDTMMPDKEVTSNDNTISLVAANRAGPGDVPAGLSHETRLRVIPSGGTATAVEAVEGGIESHVRIESADSVLVLVSAASSFVNYDDVSGDPVAKNDAVFAAYDESSQSYEDLKQAHIDSYQELYNRFSVELGPANETAEALPLDVRVSNFATAEDPGLISLFLQFGRYLLISSGRDGAQPPNLQGIWQDSINPAWGR